MTGYIVGGMFGFPIMGAIIGSNESPKTKTNIYIQNDYLIQLNDSIWINISSKDYSQFKLGDMYKLIKYK